MSEKKRTLLIPQYMKSFQCVGPACEDSCCAGWRVDIDHGTYKKYQRVRDEELSRLFDGCIARNRAAGHGEGNYAKVKLLKDASCPFLNEEKLCRIQLKRGEGYLSDVCSTYPRVVNIIDGVAERSATVSCPAAARLALLAPDIMEFDEAEEEVSVRNIIRSDINTNDLKLKSKPQKYFWELRFFSVGLLQNRNYLLSERLIILGMFCRKLQDYISESRLDEIPELITTYTNIIEDGSFRDSLSNIPVQYAIQMELLKEISDKRYFLGIQSQRYVKCYSEFLNGIQYTAEAKVEEIGQRYRDFYNQYYLPFMTGHEHILENYLVNHVFKNLFPFTEEKSLFDSYMMLVLHYALIKMHLIGMAGFHKRLDEELAIMLIQSFAKTTEHSRKYLDNVADLLKQNGYNTMAYMAILIKN